jgi:hypothetical protein
MTRHSIDTCARCGEPESEHHEFEARGQGCACDLDAICLHGEMRPPCDRYDDAKAVGYCDRCLHDRECHEVKR